MIKKISLIATAISIIFIILFSLDIFASIDNKITDSQFKHRHSPIKAPIIILAIDDYSIDHYQIWPWPRKIYTDVVKLLAREKAAVIGFDVDFDSHSSYDTQSDRVFAQAIKEAGNVVLARQSKRDRNQNIFFVDPIDILKQNAQLAIVQPLLDKDRFIRDAYLVAKTDERIYPYFAFAIASKFFNQPLSDRFINLNSSRITLGPHTFHNRIKINYAGPSKSFPVIPIAKVLEPDFLKYNKDMFKNKIVLIGSTAVYLQDLYGSPTDLYMPGVEIHANIINTLFTGLPLKNIPHNRYIVIILLSTFFIMFFTLRYKGIAGLFAMICISLIYFAMGRILFVYSIIIQIVAPISALFTGYLATILTLYLNEEEKKDEIKQIFNQYVSPAVVSELLSDKTKLKLGGDKKEVTIFFSDIRGFTTFSENHNPEQVITQLNEYLNTMAEIIFEYGGTLDKFVGDEIMAVWGSPLHQPDHATLAVRCALKQLDALHHLQAKWESESKPVLDIGIGINSGEVIAGNVGAEKYKDYTVIGDEVNLAARLEAYTRNISEERKKICRFIISDKTKKLIEDRFVVESLGEIHVKGKKTAIIIWEVISEKVAER